MDFEKKVGATIEKYSMISHGDALLLGVSGGPDSIALLHVMAKLADEYGLSLDIAHMVHGIRKKKGWEDARFVEEVAKGLGLPFHLKEVNIPEMRSEVGQRNSEALGRKERYRFFSNLAQAKGFNKVVTGHTRDDQSETIFMWLLRGSGRRGLGGIPPVRRLDNKVANGKIFPLLIRPMIKVSRDEIIDYLSEHALSYRIDETNFNTHRLRSWIRHSLLPKMRERVDPGLDERLLRSAEILRDEEELLNCLIQEKLNQISRGSSLIRDPLLMEGKAMQRGLVRCWLENLSGNLLGVGFEHVEAALHLIQKGPPQGCLSLPRGWKLFRHYNLIRLARDEHELKISPDYRYILPYCGELLIPEAGLKLRSTCESFTSVEQPRDDLEALFDKGSLPGVLTVRNFQPGDRFQPLGMQGHKKIKDLFIEKKLPFSQRRKLPLLFSGEDILWIPRCGRSEVAKAGPETKEILKVRVEALE